MTLLLLAAALLALPSASAERWRALSGKRSRRFRWRPPGRWAVVLAGAVLGAGAGVGGVVAGALVAVTAWSTRKDRRVERERLRATAALAEGLSGFVAELRSGAHPARAAANAAEDAEPPAKDVFRVIAATSARGGNVETALADRDSRSLGRAWRLSGEHGVPLADVLEEVRRDLRRRVAFAQRFHARMAGPRSSAAVLAALPVFGVLLGELTGSGPAGVLASTAAGQVLLVAGVALICAGLRWSARLTRQVVT
ncbi:type II secretion system F family protein [Saccharothrix obliqua]|uniref:type II secretion system F family protein n=1 Tax=Saccharothrix obliqua TaxID=2861747 RepID=UPI001C5E3D00|nr:type II secretion system F family protein [Saccharothrix obliqua]MBW4719792.1 type II secretion system F family protein [Saccharothrix obliqua]